MDRQTLHELIAALALDAPDIEEIHVLSDGRWVFGFDDGLMITGEWSEESSVLGLTCHIGVPPAEKRLQACELLLLTNQFSVDTPVVRGALACNGEFSLVRIAELIAPTQIEVRTLLSDLAELGRRWQRIVQGELPVANSSPPYAMA